MNVRLRHWVTRVHAAYDRGAVGGPWFAEAADAFVTAFASVGAVGAVLAGVSAYAVWRLVPADLTLDDAHH